MAIRTQALVNTLLDRHGSTLVEELGIVFDEDQPPPTAGATPDTPVADPLFQLLTGSLLLCLHAPWDIAVASFHELHGLGWTNAQEVLTHSREDIATALVTAGYPDGADSEASRVAHLYRQLAGAIEEKYEGNVANLRAQAGEDPRVERRHLQDLAGLSEICVDVFFREVQAVWPEVYPFADERARRSAAALGFPKSPATLSRLVDKDEFPRFIAALVRADVAGDHAAIRQLAAQAS